ncbi:MAG: HAMP domain-containing sensor histidine kinase [Pseudomonadota bacterium]
MMQLIRSELRSPAIRVPGRLVNARPDRRTDEIASISHEMRNSLAVVRNAARLLRAPASAVHVDNARALIERHVAQLALHVEDLLNTASQPNGKQRALYRSHVDLRTVVQHAVSAISPDIAQRGHRLVTDLPDEALWVHADAARLEQVFANLLINAAKYTPNGGDIVIHLKREGAQASIVVRDSGIGMEPAVLARVFELYSQADSMAPHSEGGSGIGLAVVRDLVEKHGGSVHATSPGLGHGSEFTVLLPVMWGSAP